MPSSSVDRRGESVEGHLAAAVEYLAIAESGDAARAAYEHAADEILAAKAEDPSSTWLAIAQRIRRSDNFVGQLVRWRESGMQTPTPFSHGGQSDHRRGSDRAATKRIARERPDDYVEAFRQAPPEARKEIAREISRAPEVRAEARQRDVEAEQVRRPSPVMPRADLVMYQFESRLATADSNLRQALKLLGEVDQAGDDEDVLDQIERLKQLVSVIEEAYRTGKSLDTWAAELYEERAE